MPNEETNDGLPSAVDLNAAAEAAMDAALAQQESDAPEEEAPPPAAAPAAEAPAAEAPVTPDPAALELDSRVSELVRRESDMVRREQEGKLSMAQAQADARAARAEAEALLAKLKENPMDVLNEHGWDLESLAQAAASSRTPEAIRTARVEAELRAMKAREGEREQQAAAREEQAKRDNAARQIREELIPTQLADSKDELPLVHAWLEPAELANAVFDLMGRAYNESKGATVISPVEAARKLEHELSKRAQRLPGATVTPAATSKPVKRTAAPSATVTNQNTQARSSNVKVDALDPESLDAIARAELQALFQNPSEA